MRRRMMMLLASLMTAYALFAQNAVKGVVKMSGSGNPVSGAVITVLKQNISTQTNSNGEFTIQFLQPGKDDISISHVGFFTIVKSVEISAKSTVDLGTIEMTADETANVQQEIVLQLSEEDLNNDESKSNQSSSSSLASRGDVYTNQTNFSFSPMRFQTRGYDQRFESTYINGVYFNGLERDNFNYSSMGGLNDAFRNHEENNGISASWFSYGNLGSTTNIDARASSLAAGSKASIAYTNRTYKLRGAYTFATGLMNNGWAFAASIVGRWADKGIIEGSFYNSMGYFFAAEKVFNKRHSLSLVTFGAPTQRTQQSAITEEVKNLYGSIYYNPYWGYQNGKMRNSRIVKSFDPTAILSHDFKIDENKRLRSGIAYHYSMYSNSALTYYNAPNPSPDYYSYMPSTQQNSDNNSLIKRLFTPGDVTTTQINWDELYHENQMNNVSDPNGIAKYALERRHNDLQELAFNSVYNQQVSSSLKLTAGVEAKASKGMHYKTMDDLLGANQWVDKDQFAEQDYSPNSSVIQNDLNHPNRVIHKGDIFGYNYDLIVKHANVFLQNEWNWSQIDLFYAAKVNYTEFYRYGHMLNGRAEAVGAQSYGKGKVWYATTPSVKMGATYKIDGHNNFYINGSAEERAPQVDNSYVSIRIKDTAVPMEKEQVYSADANYSFNYSAIRGRISGFYTQVKHSSDLYGYYDDVNNTFVNFMLSGMNKSYKGVELGVSTRLNSNFTLSVAGTYADYRYTSNAIGTRNYENGKYADSQDTIYTKNLKVASGPQMAGSISLRYFHPQMWFFDVTLNYFDNNYLDFAPSRFAKSSMALYTTDDIKKAYGTQEKLNNGCLLDASIGKVVYLKNKRSININLSASNILNNTKLKTGGYQQGRVYLNSDNSLNASNLNMYPNKYYYAWGLNMFLNVSYKF